jgi:hypothetical protein
MNSLAYHLEAIPLQREKTHYHLNEAIYTDGTSWNGKIHIMLIHYLINKLLLLYFIIIL